MDERIANWVIYTCAIGLLPAICRLLVWLISGDSSPYSVTDIVFFGIVLHSANINEINRANVEDGSWKTLHGGSSTIFVIIYSLILYGTMSDPGIDSSVPLLGSAIAMGIVSIGLTLAVNLRLVALDPKEAQ